MSPKRRDQRKAQKRAAREKEKKRARAAAQRHQSRGARIERAARLPLRECRISRDFRHYGFAQVLVAREGSDGIVLGAMLVDMMCLGVKGGMVQFLDDEEAYREAVARFEAVEPFEVCVPELAAKVASDSERMASELGFRTPDDARAAASLLAGIDASACEEVFKHRIDGKPVFAAIAEDDVPSVLRRLAERVGADGFYFGLPDFAVGDAPDHLAQFIEPYLQYVESDQPALRTYGRVRCAQARLQAAATRFALMRFGRDFFEETAEVHHGSLDVDVAENAEFLHHCFLPWALFAFANEAGETIGSLLLEERGDALEPFERELCEQLVGRPFSLLAVRAVEPDGTVTVHDLLSGAERVVTEPVSGTDFQVGWILRARVVTLGEVSVIVGMSERILPPFLQITALDLRDRIAGEGNFLDAAEIAQLDATQRSMFDQWDEQISGGDDEDSDGDSDEDADGVEPEDALEGDDAEEAEQLSPTWCDDPHPSLGGRSPREAAATVPGRERVEALIASLVELLPGTDADELRGRLELPS